MTISPAGRAAVLLAALCAALIASVTLASPAHATAYRYWSYWQGASGQWVAAQTGPGDHTVVDQDVQGWRFAISTEAVTQMPDNAADFAALCPDLAAQAAPVGQLRVAVVVDSGFAADAPSGQVPPGDVVSCVTVPEGSTGNQALAAAASVTVDESLGLVCAVNGYPTDECGAEVSDADAAAAASAAETEQPNPAVVTAGSTTTADDASGSSPVPFLAGAALLAALLLAAWLIPVARRRRLAAHEAAELAGDADRADASQ